MAVCEMKLVNRIILGLVITLLALVSLLLIVTLFYSTEKKMEIGSLTDWIIALANVVMAIAAVFAAISAKNWFANKINDSSFNKAIEIIATFDSLKSQLDRFHFEIISLGKDLSPELIEYLTPKLKDLTYNVSSLLRSINNTTCLGFEMNSEIKSQISRPFQEYVNTAWEHINFYKNDTVIVKHLRDTFRDKDQTDKLSALLEQTNKVVQILNVDLRKIFMFRLNM